MREPLLTVASLRVEFGERDPIVRAVRGVSFTMAQGEVFALVGESGSGKSVTAHAITRLLPDQARVTATEMIFDGEDLLRASPNQMQRLRGRRISMVFQDPLSRLNPLMQIGRQITEGLEAHERLTRAAGRSLAIQLLRDVGIPDPHDAVRAYPHEFSGGMVQRAMIAMALAESPDLLIADEPTTALDVTTESQILELLTSLKDKSDFSILLITHDLAITARFANSIGVMYAGRIVEYGEALDILQTPLHPYTAGLIEAVPRRDRERGDYTVIPGRPPNLSQDLPACPFAPRCERSTRQCWDVAPPFVARSSTSSAGAWCHHPL